MIHLIHGMAKQMSTSLGNGVRHKLGGRAILLVLAGNAIAGGLALNWNWLVAVGVAPLLLTALPCVAMCALGLCMTHSNGSQSNAPSSAAYTRRRTNEEIGLSQPRRLTDA